MQAKPPVSLLQDEHMLPQVMMGQADPRPNLLCAVGMPSN